MDTISKVSQARGGSIQQMDLSLYILMMRSKEIEERRRKTLLAVTSPKQRPLTTNVKYSIGMVMKHQRLVVRVYTALQQIFEQSFSRLG